MKPNSTPKLVPLNNAQSDVVDVNLVLPAAVGLEQLGIDIIRLETLCKVAGISKLTIRNKKDDSKETTIVGRNRDGTAIGGLMGSKTASLSTQKKKKGFKMIARTEVNIEIDIATLAHEIIEKNPEGVRSLHGWSQELEEIITKHVGNEGLKFLLSVEKGAMRVDMIVICSMLGIGISPQASALINVMAALTCRMLGCILAQRLASKLFGEDMYVRTSPLSIAGIEWDRALVLIGMIASTRNLIGKIGQD